MTSMIVVLCLVSFVRSFVRSHSKVSLEVRLTSSDLLSLFVGSLSLSAVAMIRRRRRCRRRSSTCSLSGTTRQTAELAPSLVLSLREGGGEGTATAPETAPAARVSSCGERTEGGRERGTGGHGRARAVGRSVGRTGGRTDGGGRGRTDGPLAALAISRSLSQGWRSLSIWAFAVVKLFPDSSLTKISLGQKTSQMERQAQTMLSISSISIVDLKM